MAFNFFKGNFGIFNVNKDCRLILIYAIYNMKSYWQWWMVKLLNQSNMNKNIVQGNFIQDFKKTIHDWMT